jgi:hypothetical protein
MYTKESAMNTKRMSHRLVLVGFAVVLAACASFPSNIKPGQSRDELIAIYGPPAGLQRTPQGEVLIFSTAPFGQTAYAARLGLDGRVQAVEQVLTSENFARITLGEWTRDRVRSEFGAPAEVGIFSSKEVWWSYRFKENGVWNTLMNVMFDESGIARQTINTPDPLYTPDSNRPDN